MAVNRYDDTRAWYAISTYSGYEDKVASSMLNVASNCGLDDDILDIKIPKKEILLWS